MNWKILGAIIAVGLRGALASANQPSFMGLGDLPGSEFNSSAAAVSYDGSVVVGGSVSTMGHQGFRWTAATGMAPLGALTVPGSSNPALGVSGDGSVAVGMYQTSIQEGYRWTAATGMVSVGNLGAPYTFAFAASGDGSVVVGSGLTGALNGARCFRWTEASGIVSLGDLPSGANFCQAKGISADGHVIAGIGWGWTANRPEAFRWTEETGMVGLGDLPGGGFGSGASGISADGSVVFGSSDSGSSLHWEAFRWTEAEGMIGLGLLPGALESNALAASADGSIIVGNSDPATSSAAAFVWDAAHGMRSLRGLLTDLGLDLTGWTLESANGVSADGRTIVGSGRNAFGQHEAWLVVIPEPSVITIMLMGIVAGRRRITSAFTHAHLPTN